ncbi:MAG: hypothetical protein JNK85_00580 [Verrucomicrobiales bacterium]|nr:hypothetical protein [Verrucomicrobiales bacterium]
MPDSIAQGEMKEIINDHHAWYVVRTARDQEKAVADALAVCDGIEVFLPWIRSRIPANSQPALKAEPVFPRHLFVRATVQNLLRQLDRIDGAKELAAYGGHVAEIPETEIATFRGLFDSSDSIPHPPHCHDPKATFALENDPWLHLRAAIEYDFPAARRVRFLCRKLRIQARDHHAPTLAPTRRRHPINATAPAPRAAGDHWVHPNPPTSQDRVAHSPTSAVES